MKKLFHHPFFIRLRHWEYWNSTIVYLPLYPYWAWLSLKARSFYFITAANPSIKNGGLINESKNEVYKLIPEHLYPKTFHVTTNTPAHTLKHALKLKGITYPMLAKPDIGERGIGVKKINSEQELEQYTLNMPVDFLVQEYINYPYEAGVFYYRIPGEDTGHISGIVFKEPVVITGDGKHTIEELAIKNERYYLQIKQIKKLHAAKLQHILKDGEQLELIPYGNHSRGSKFTDVTYRSNKQLTESIDRICKSIDGFYFGRLDIRFKDWDSLEKGENISIIELNGSGSEPTHIYDPRNTIFDAWREIIKHWKIAYRICIANRRNGVPYTSFNEARKEQSDFKKLEQLLSTCEI